MSDLDRYRRRCKELESLMEAIAVIAQDLRLSGVLHRVVEQAISVTRGEAGTLWLADEQQQLAPSVIIGGATREQLSRMRLAPGEGVAGRVYESGKPLIIRDVHGHPRWARRFDSATGFKTNSLLCTPLFTRGRKLGAVQIVNRAGGGFFQDDDLTLLTELSAHASSVIDASLMLQQGTMLTTSLMEVIAGALDGRSLFLAGHSMRVAEYSLLLGREIGLSAEELEKLRRAALLHDIGKYSMPAELLSTGIELSPEEGAALRRHAEEGAQLLAKVQPPSLMTEVVQAVRQHHERPGGGGYPEGLVGDRISLFARIIAVADTYDHLTAQNPFRETLGFEEALGEIIRQGGTALDAELASRFFSVMNRNRPKG